MEELDLGGDLTYSKKPIKILDTVDRETRNKVIKMCKVQWSHHMEDETTWEHEEECDRTPPPPEQVGVCLPRFYQGIFDEARMRKHTHKHTIQ
jgi:hypothetical protein